MASINLWWTTSLIVTISLARIGMGISTALSGPTLLYLAGNVGTTVSTLSTMFTWKAIGTLIGAILGGVVKSIVGPNFRHLLTLGAGFGVFGLTYLAVPWITEFWLLIITVTISGIMFGYLDAGFQALILQLWGEAASRVQIQLFHLMYGVGAFLGPLIATPFLVEADQQTSAARSCPQSPPEATTPHSANYSTTSVPHIDFNPTGLAYIIAACWILFVSLLVVLLAVFNTEARVSASVEDSGHSSENRAEEPIKDLIFVFLLVIAFYFCTVATENVFFNFIYSVSICSDLNFTVAQASKITSVFWLGFGLGRLSGVLVAAYFKPRTIIIFSIIGSIVDMIFMCTFGEQTEWLAWLVSALHGYAVAMLYPSGVSWLSQITNISGTYMFICNIGNAIGSLSMLPLAGYLFDNVDPFSVMYFTLCLAVANAGFYALLLYVGRRHVRLRYAQTKQRNEGISGETERLMEDEEVPLQTPFDS